MLKDVVVLDIDKYHKILDESEKNLEENTSMKLLLISMIQQFGKNNNHIELDKVFTELDYKVEIEHKNGVTTIGRGHKLFKIEIK